MPWIVLLFAGLFEIGFAVGLKLSDGFTRLWPSVITAVSIVISGALLAYAARSLPIGTAYAVWTGIGTLGTLIFGIVWLGEPSNAFRLGCVALIAVGIVGLKAA